MTMADAPTPAPPAPLPGIITGQPNAPLNTADKLLAQLIGDLVVAVKAFRP